MKVCVDVGYGTEGVVAACVGFDDWSDATSALERTMRFDRQPDSYESGQFYRRELPFALELVKRLDGPLDVVVVDGYVWLDEGRPGLGAHLHEALSSKCPVIGVAKRPFRAAASAVSLVRGTSKRPLFVSAAGLAVDEAVQCIARMHGPHRIPTLLKRVDHLSRT